MQDGILKLGKELNSEDAMNRVVDLLSQLSVKQEISSIANKIGIEKELNAFVQKFTTQ